MIADMNEPHEYHGLVYEFTQQGHTPGGNGCGFIIYDSEGNHIVNCLNVKLDANDSGNLHLHCRFLIDGYLLGLELGKRIGANNLRHDLKRLLNTGTTL